jgi:adenylate cyclase
VARTSGRVVTDASDGRQRMTVTSSLVVFLDVADSRGLYRSLGDRLAHEQIAAALSAVEAALEGHGGEVIKRVGDAVLCRFADCARGVDALDAVQRGTDLNWRVGAHCGPVLASEGDIFGDTVNRAARLAALARAREILVTQEVVDSLPEPLAGRCRPVERVRLKGDDAAGLLHRYDWEASQATAVNTAISITALKIRGELRLDTPTGTTRLLPGETFRIGRDPQCDLVLDDVRISRLHATLQWRRGRYVLCDHSTNGSYVHAADATRPVFIRREEMPLAGCGRISLAAMDGGPVLDFRYE